MKALSYFLFRNQILILILTLSACFNERSPKKPDENTNWISPTEPNILLENFKKAVSTLDFNNYRRCLAVEKFSFKADQTIAANNLGLFANWIWDTETQFFNNLRQASTPINGNNILRSEEEHYDRLSNLTKVIMSLLKCKIDELPYISIEDDEKLFYVVHKLYYNKYNPGNFYPNPFEEDNYEICDPNSETDSEEEDNLDDDEIQSEHDTDDDWRSNCEDKSESESEYEDDSESDKDGSESDKEDDIDEKVVERLHSKVVDKLVKKTGESNLNVKETIIKNNVKNNASELDDMNI
jgi:hypothetical protein